MTLYYYSNLPSVQGGGDYYQAKYGSL